MNVSRILLPILAALSLSTANAVTSYTVQAGDTIQTIAQASKIEPDVLMRLNGLQSPTVEVGQVLKTSGFGGTETAASRAAAAPTQVGPQLPVSTSKVAVSSKASAQLKPASSGGAFITTAASRYLGIRYLHGGVGGRGIDCSGFTLRVFQSMGINLPRTAAGQFRMGSPVSSRNLRPGDLVFFNTTGVPASHVGIYLGNGMMAGANSYFGRTMIEPLFSNPYWAARYIGARRIMG